MTIYSTAYETTYGSALITKPIRVAINEALVKGMGKPTTFDLIPSLKIIPIWLTGYDDNEAQVPSFIHPIYLKGLVGMHDKEFLVTDLRPFMRQEKAVDVINRSHIRNISEFDVARSRAIMQLAWLTGKIGSIRNDLMWAGTVFAGWLSDVISKRFALDPADQLKLFIVSHYYYQSLFIDSDVVDEDILQKFAIHTIKASKAPSNVVFDTFDKIGIMGGLDSLCTAFKDVLENVRLKDLDKGVLISLVGYSWYGSTSGQLLAVALEHPPTWVAIVNSAIQDRTFKNSAIARVAEKFGKQGQASDYLKAFAHIASQYAVSTSTESLDDPLSTLKPFE